MIKIWRSIRIIRCEEAEKGRGETRAAADVDQAMVCKGLGAPVERADVRPHVPCGAVPKVGDEERTECPVGVEAAKDEREFVAVKEGADAGEAAGNRRWRG